MADINNIYNSSFYEYLNPSQNRYGNLELYTYPDTQVVTTAELKSQLRIDTNDENDLLATYISAATQMAEHYCNRHFINAIYRLYFFDNLPDSFSLYFPDCSILAHDVGGADDDGLWYLPESSASTNNYVALGNTNWLLKNSNPSIVSKSSSYAEPNSIIPVDIMDGANKARWYFQFSTGMGAAASDVPDAIKQAIKLIASDMYYFREDRKRAFPMASEILLQPYKCYL